LNIPSLPPVAPASYIFTGEAQQNSWIDRPIFVLPRRGSGFRRYRRSIHESAKIVTVS
jgi:hypothetical protein